MWEVYRLRTGKPGPYCHSEASQSLFRSHVMFICTLFKPLVYTCAFYKMKEQEEALFGFLEYHGC